MDTPDESPRPQEVTSTEPLAIDAKPPTDAARPLAVDMELPLETPTERAVKILTHASRRSHEPHL